jgi:UDP-N-acetylglucosamine 2-epimerase (non-hydrolysing)
VYKVGNTAVDAALAAWARLELLLAQGAPVLPLQIEALRTLMARRPTRLITVTAHRRENWGTGIRDTARAVATLLATHPDLAAVWPVHGNHLVSDTVYTELGALQAQLDGRLTLCPPLDYPAMLWCLLRSELVLTDSGGIQEEGAALSTPVLVLRNTTERPELIEAGAGLLVGTDPSRIVETVNHLLANAPALTRMRDAVNPFGDGRTSARIAHVLQRDLGL